MYKNTQASEKHFHRTTTAQITPALNTQTTLPSIRSVRGTFHLLPSFQSAKQTLALREGKRNSTSPRVFSTARLCSHHFQRCYQPHGPQAPAPTRTLPTQGRRTRPSARRSQPRTGPGRPGALDTPSHRSRRCRAGAAVLATPQPHALRPPARPGT